MAVKAHLSQPIIKLATSAPRFTEATLWMAAKVFPRLKPHWVLQKVVCDLNCRIPVDAHLRNGMSVRVVWLDSVAHEILTNGFYEVSTVAVIQRLLKPGSIFIDVGAHVGQYTLVASGLVGEEGEVHSFEPHPATFDLLRHNVASNRITNVRLNQVALGDSTGSASLCEATPDNIGAASLRAPTNFSGKAIGVQCTTLDEYVGAHRLPRIDLVKIDVEGAELPVLEGAASALSSKPTLIVEFSEHRQRAFGYSCGDLVSCLKGHGYDLFRITDSGPVSYATADDEATFFNVLAVPIK